MDDTSATRTARIRKVLIITLALNICVSVTKVAYGYMTDSVAILADGFHSMFDGVSNIVGFVGIYLASNPPDEDHPYGHRKYETVFTIFIGVMMFMTCIEIFKKVYESLTGGKEATVTVESFIIMIATLGVNIFVSTYENRKGRELGSEFLVADSMHTKSDIFASSGVITGLIFIKLGFPAADAVVGIVVALLVARTGFGVLREAAEALVDRRQIDTAMIRNIACSIDNVEECHRIRTRGSNNHIFLDLHVLVNPLLSIEIAHQIAHLVEEKIRGNVNGVVDVVVHVEPALPHEKEEEESP